MFLSFAARKCNARNMLQELVGFLHHVSLFTLHTRSTHNMLPSTASQCGASPTKNKTMHDNVCSVT